MMTLPQLLDVIEEIRGLERLLTRVRALMADGTAATEWRYAEVALVDRVRWLTYYRERENGGFIDRADAVLRAGVTSAATDAPEWAYVLLAIADRLKWSTYALSVTDPQLIAQAEAVLNAAPDPVFTSTDWATAWTDRH